MKKAFVSIYVLLILLIFGLTISFISGENETNFDSVQSLYNKRIAIYEAESFLNIFVKEKNINKSTRFEEILDNFDHKAKITIEKADDKGKIKEKDAKLIFIKASYKNTVGNAILTYRLGDDGKISPIYKKVY